MPDDRRLHTAARGLGREAFDGRAALRRQWPLRIDVWTNRIAVVNKKEVHGDYPMKGWLLVLCVWLLVWQPLNLALTMSSALASLAVRGAPLAIAIVVRTIVAAVGIAAGLALVSRQPAAVTLAKVALILSAAMDVIVYSTRYFPSNRYPGDAPIYIAATTVYHAAWLAYLFRSTRVRQTFR